MSRPGLEFPSALTVLFIVAALVAVLTWFIPAGQYEQLAFDANAGEFVQSGQGVEQRYPATQETLDQLGVNIALDRFTSGAIWKPVGIPGTYRQLGARPQGVVAFLQSPLKGIIQAIDVILFVLILGGFIGVTHHSGAFDAGVAWLARALKGRETWLIILVTGLVALGGTTFGLAEETIAFYPILVPVFLAAGYDAMVALAAIYVGSSIGTMASTVNPFSVIIGSHAAGINWTVGLYGRIAVLVFGTGICIWYIIRYAEKVRRTPSASLTYEQNDEIAARFLHLPDSENNGFTTRIKLVLAIFVLSFATMIFGVSRLDWWFLEMTTVFLCGALLIGVVARIREKSFVEEFVKGAASLLGVALIIGVARGVTVLMEEGMISDTLLFHASMLVDGMPRAVFVNVMMLLYAGMSFFVSSSSGMAVLSMPILAPLADVVGVGRELVVDAYQYGMGLFAFISPTGLILASLAMVHVTFDKWLRFVMPLLIYLTLFTMLMLTVLTYVAV